MLKWLQELELSLCASDWCVFNISSYRLGDLFENITNAQCCSLIFWGVIAGDGCLKTTHRVACLFPFPKPW